MKDLITAAYLELDDRVRFGLTGERCKVVERENGSVTLRWPSGDRLTYEVTDGIWYFFTMERGA